MALTGGYVGINAIMEEVRGNGFEDLYKDEMKEWVWKVLGYIGVPDSYVSKYSKLKIEEFKALLPEDFFEIMDGGIRLSLTKQLLRRSTDIFYTDGFDSKADPFRIIAGQSVNYLDDEKTDDSTLYVAEYNRIYPEESLTYIINDYVITTGFRDGEIEIMYKGYATDDFNNPLIPDNPKIIRAVVSFAMERIAFRLMLKDELSERKYENIKQDYMFNVGAAITAARTPSPSEMENYSRRASTLQGNFTGFNHGFKRGI
jgi:hypothetical protein